MSGLDLDQAGLGLREFFLVLDLPLDGAYFA
jgi:hypothetical protein